MLSTEKDCIIVRDNGEDYKRHGSYRKKFMRKADGMEEKLWVINADEFRSLIGFGDLPPGLKHGNIIMDMTDEYEGGPFMIMRRL
ncbi:MAG: hypothetical protein HY883_02520 [Deltaproteobacteria bacterium]|nr:hypothetical protein [Deltaproteobacteria bacterium]